MTGRLAETNERNKIIPPAQYANKHSSSDDEDSDFKDIAFPQESSSAQVHLHTIRKVKFLSKNSILTNPQHIQEFFTKIFFDNFSREIKVVNS